MSFFTYLCRFVADKMGGPIDRGQVSNFSWELPVSQLKLDLKSNVIPIGMIKTGIHYHRALLFKVCHKRRDHNFISVWQTTLNSFYQFLFIWWVVDWESCVLARYWTIILPVWLVRFFTPLQALADRIAVSCSLIRGQYNRAWNVVMLPEESTVSR